MGLGTCQPFKILTIQREVCWIYVCGTILVETQLQKEMELREAAAQRRVRALVSTQCPGAHRIGNPSMSVCDAITALPAL